MTPLINIGAILVFALLVFGVVWAAFRFLLSAEPHQPAKTEPPRTRRRRLAADIVWVVAVFALLDLAVEVRSAYGAPYGDRDALTVEVVEVGECDRAPLGFGIARSCELTAYRHTDPELDPAPWEESIEVITGEKVQSGDLVARYSPTGWTKWLFLGAPDPQWRPISAETHPNLVWLPTATLIAATVLGIPMQRIAQRRRGPGSGAT